MMNYFGRSFIFELFEKNVFYQNFNSSNKMIPTINSNYVCPGSIILNFASWVLESQ